MCAEANRRSVCSFNRKIAVPSVVWYARTPSTSELAARFGMSAPAVSRHLSTLENAGLVTSRRDGQRVLYGLVRDTVMEALSGFAAELAMGPGAGPARPKRQREAL